MFDRLRKAFTRNAHSRPSLHDAEGAASEAPALGPVSVWAASQGLSFGSRAPGVVFSLKGTVGGRPWRLEVGRPSRPFIEGDELRARAELGVDPEVSVVVMNRVLKDALENEAYSVCTDSLQTAVGGGMTEEMRWLAMYEDVAWESAPRSLWAHWAVLASKPQHAPAWLHDDLVQRMLGWPAPGLAPAVPFVLALRGGKVYLRMQQGPGGLAGLRHATGIFTAAAESALECFAAAGSR
ncbi:MAG TPA: hypothetical protein VFE82_12160 [Ramlibacter sp.]|jgi:hypothetical protein|uniref:hypothetical protein n=1 Tax=Ramlibacter sp. TaxID=1917967 RepID=UPI002D52A8DA|nr:hypothetical protein [Ramlibacter sp.]HZY19226.1 hypothetical protein [Ramlibacter sp.]